MDWLWQGIEGPRDLPDWAYRYLLDHLKAEPEQLACLEGVEQTSFQGSLLVKLIRIFDRRSIGEGITVDSFTSLDQHPELILYEGYREEESGRVYIVRKA